MSTEPDHKPATTEPSTPSGESSSGSSPEPTPDAGTAAESGTRSSAEPVAERIGLRARPAGNRAIVVRPRKVRKIAWACAAVLVVAFGFAAVFLRQTPTGVYFHASDQVSMMLLGIILAALVLLFTRPRLRIEADGVEVRNVLTTRKYTWPEITSVAFPEGSAWARLELPDDEYITIMAIQATDGAYAVKAMRALRAAYRKATQ